MELLTQLISLHGAHKVLRSDNGSEFVSRAFLRWATSQNLNLALIDFGKLRLNGTTESLNGKFRDEYLSLERFRHRVDVKVVIEQWHRHWNEVLTIGLKCKVGGWTGYDHCRPEMGHHA